MSLSRNFVVSSVEGPDFPYSLILERKDSIESLLFTNRTITELTKEETDSLKFSPGFTVEKLCDTYACLGVFSLSEADDWLVLVSGFSLVGKFSLAEIFKITAVSMISFQDRQKNDPDYLSDVRKFLGSGFFYFCPSSITNYDITRSIQRQTLSSTQYPTPFLDPRSRSFFWNRSFWRPFLLSGVASTSDWLVRVICGGIEMRTVYVGSNAVRVMIISRLSCERAGTRFTCRGCDDNGHVANFVETEQLIVKDESELSSFVQVRGSVPLLWEQTGYNLGKHFVRLSRGFEACAPAFERHFSRLFRHYNDVTVVNLLHAAGRKSNKLVCEGDENTLNAWFQEHHRCSELLKNTEHITFDFHAEWKRGQEKSLEKLWGKLAPVLTKNSFFHYADGIVRTEQTGVIRTNCVDCLDRTNCVQSMLAIQVLDWQIAALRLNERSKSNRAHFVDALKQMWTTNGDHCSRIYAGTSALFGGKGKYVDVATNASRAVHSGLLDSAKHSAIHLILKSGCPTGELGDRSFAYIQEYTPYTPIWLCRELVLRYPLYTTQKPLRIFVGSWNVNGGQRTRSIAYKEDSINDWLTDFIEVTQRDRPELLEFDKDYSQPIDIYAIGFQEIVDLNAQNIVSADTKNQEEWAQRLLKAISANPDRQYIYLSSIQLVGVCLMVFIRPHLAPFLRDVAVGSVKTGLGGATGNKGGVAVRFRLHSSSICFVCGHLAAGQNKVSDRNSDLADIANRLSFPQGGTVWNHDYIYLFGDFNYRIGQLGNQVVRDLVAAKQYRELAQYEQLQLECIKAHEALQKFVSEKGGDADRLPTWQRVLSTFYEGNIDFAPTYKYDVYSDDYDTSEKNRVPAWTDRILWTRRPLYVESSLENQEQESWNSGRLLLYNRAEVRTSDHRPVYALFDIDVFQVDEKKMRQTYADFINDVGPIDGSVVVEPNANAEAATSDDLRMIVSSCGSISVMRYVNNKAIVTFSDTREAADALKLATNTMFRFEPKFKNMAWYDAISKMLASNMDDFSLISSNKLLAEPVSFDLINDRDSPYPEDSDVQQQQPTEDEEELNYTSMAFLSVTDKGMHMSKSDDNLRARTPPPPRPPPPQAAKKPVNLSSSSNGFINAILISRPAAVEAPVAVKGCPFTPKSSKFVKLTSIGAIHVPKVPDGPEGENGSDEEKSKVVPSMSVDDMFSIPEQDSPEPPVDPGTASMSRNLPPSRPPPPAAKPPAVDPFQTESHAKFNVEDTSQPIIQPTPLSWPDAQPTGPAPPRRAPPPAPVATELNWPQPTSTAPDPWGEPQLPSKPVANNKPVSSSDPFNAWPDDSFAVPSSVPSRAPPPPRPAPRSDPVTSAPPPPPAPRTEAVSCGGFDTQDWEPSLPAPPLPVPRRAPPPVPQAPPAHPPPPPRRAVPPPPPRR